MSVWNPFLKETQVPTPNPEAVNTPAAPEKTQAELIAESVSAAIKPLVDANTALSSRLESIETNTKRPTPATTPTERTSIFDDEDAAFAQRVGPVMQRQLVTEAKLAYNDVKSEYVAAGYAELLTKYESQVIETLNNSPLVTQDGKVCRGDTGYIRNVIDMVFGRAARESGMKFGGREKGFFIESAGAEGGTSTPSPADDGLTVEQRRVFNRMGVPTADAKKTIGKLKFIN